jgi:predicted PurR-regulated permease PerM
MNEDITPQTRDEARSKRGSFSFSFERFYRANRRILIWVILAVLLWLLRSFFSLIFLTFVFAFIAAPLSDFIVRKLRFPRRLAICVTFGALVAILSWIVTFIVPQVAREAMNLVGNLPKTEERLMELRRTAVAKYPIIEPVLMNYLRGTIPEAHLVELDAELKKQEADEAAAAGTTPSTPGEKSAIFAARENEAVIHLFVNLQIQRLTNVAPGLIRAMWAGSATVLLSLLFSFLISLDIVRLGEEVRNLRNSKLRHFYEEMAMPVVRFGYVVGRTIQAQAMVAVVNTVLTLVGLSIIGVPLLAVLLMIVFLCSFIPVLGVFISTVPIILVAINSGGLYTAVLAVLMVVAIHAVEAYVLNPMIYGRHLKINPVLVLIILFIGHHAFGVWGMLLGVPVAYYFIHDVFGVPIWNDRRLIPRPLPATAPPEQKEGPEVP